MSNESKQPEQNATPDAATQPKPKSGLIKYIIIGVAGLVVVVGVAFGTLMLMGGNSGPSAGDNETPAAETKSTRAAEASTSNTVDADTLPAEEALALLNDDSLLAEIMREAEADSSILDNVQASLAFLDGADTQNLELTGSGLSKADSIKEANWISEQKAELTKKETELNERARQLDSREKKIQQQLARIEQAESARVTNLAKLYDGMEPRQVAELMANLDDGTVVSVIPRMKPKNASQVLGLMPPARAAKLSKQMITIAGTE